MGTVCSSQPETARDRELQRRADKNKKNDTKVKKLLLLGAGGSGKSTFFKQLRGLYSNEITEHEKENTYRDIVFSNVINNMKTLTEKSEEMSNSGNEDWQIEPSSEKAAIWIKAFDEDHFKKNLETVRENIGILWKDKGIQHTWGNRSQFQIQDSASFFFKDINRLTKADYIPSDEDVLRVRIRTTGIVEQEFMLKNNKFQIFDVGGQRNERKKWIHCFEEVTGVMFLAALSAYDQRLYEDDNMNRMMEALDLFKQICNSRWFKKTVMILFLNKKDLFKEKIKKTPITVCFPDYKGPQEEHDSRNHIKEQFENQNERENKDLYVHFTCAIEKKNVEKVFDDVKKSVIKKNLAEAGLI